MEAFNEMAGGLGSAKPSLSWLHLASSRVGLRGLLDFMGSWMKHDELAAVDFQQIQGVGGQVCVKSSGRIAFVF